MTCSSHALLAVAVLCAACAAPSRTPAEAPARVTRPRPSSASPTPSALHPPRRAAAPETCDDAKDCIARANEAKQRATRSTFGSAAANKQQALAAKFHDRACALGSAEGCRELADEYAEGRGLEQSTERSIRALVRACDLGDMRGCTTLAFHYRWGAGGALAVDLPRSANLYDQACKAGVVDACEALAYAYQNGSGVKADPARAALLFKAVCDAIPEPGRDYAPVARSDRACLPYAQLLVEGRWVPKDTAAAFTYLQRACQAGAFEVCHQAADLVARGAGMDVPRALELYALGCDAGAHTLGCDGAARLLRAGVGIPRDDTTAAAYEFKAIATMAAGCSMHGAMEVCEAIVDRLASMRTPPNDSEAAVQMLERACDLGSVRACSLASRKHAEGLWLAQDAEHAAKLRQRAAALANPRRAKDTLQRGCDAGVLTDCYVLGDAYLRGNAAWGVPKDEQRARALITKSCTEDLDVECRVARSFDNFTPP